MNPDWPPGYDPLMWWIDRLGNMDFIHDQHDNQSADDLKKGLLQSLWWKGVFFDIL